MPKIYCATPAKQWTQCRPAWRAEQAGRSNLVDAALPAERDAGAAFLGR